MIVERPVTKAASHPVATPPGVRPLEVAWARRGGELLEAVLELTKPRITLMVVVTTAVGFLLAAPGRLPGRLFFHAVAATALLAAAASVLNQVLERDLDARMRRTAGRPLPTGRLAPDQALAVGVTLSLGGLAYLLLAVNLLTAALGAATLATYLFVYTPLKRVSSLATVVGAAPGAVPPMMGWTAVRGELTVEAWVLFAILFFWQLPHFLAIAWLYRSDYERGGFPMLPVGDLDGTRTGIQTTLYAAALLPVSLLPTPLGLAGGVYFLGALAMGVVLLALSAAFAWSHSTRVARHLARVSVAYLPVVLGLMVLDRGAA